MHILVTDSGVGGLSVCAYAERFVRTHGAEQPVRLTFVNAAPANDYGYNSMPSTEVKLHAFDRFLGIVTERYRPDAIYVACNTLAVLLPATPFARAAAIPVTGIVETSVRSLLRELAASPTSVALIFGTQTTIDAGAYPQLLQQHGVAPSRIISQACPGLADTISEDPEGARTREQITRWVAAAIEQLSRTDIPVAACLACTHYGYRKQLFADVLAAAGLEASVVNPNERAVDDMVGPSAGACRDVDVEIVTRYAIPDAALQALGQFLGDISPRTVAALQSFRHEPELF